MSDKVKHTKNGTSQWNPKPTKYYIWVFHFSINRKWYIKIVCLENSYIIKFNCVLNFQKLSNLNIQQVNWWRHLAIIPEHPNMLYVCKYFFCVLIVCVCVFVCECILSRCPATYFNSSTSGLVGQWLYDHYLKLMNNCVR